jgi:hypothetical protein
VLARQAVYHLSHAPSTSGLYFWDRVSGLCLGWPGPSPSYLCFPSGWDDRHTPACPAFCWLRWGSLKLFAWAGLKLWSFRFLPPSWDYRWEPLCLVGHWDYSWALPNFLPRAICSPRRVPTHPCHHPYCALSIFSNLMSKNILFNLYFPNYQQNGTVLFIDHLYCHPVNCLFLPLTQFSVLFFVCWLIHRSLFVYEGK